MNSSNHFSGGIADAESFERAIGARAGIVESGLFLGMATEVLVSGPAGVETLKRGDGVIMRDGPVEGDGP